jgi:hypothetical protein
LWQTHKGKYTGLSQFFWGFTFQVIALILLLFRNKMPDLFSIILANLLTYEALVYFTKVLAKNPIIIIATSLL